MLMNPHLGQELLRVATQLFAAHGYVGTSVRDIAGALHVDVATVYYHHRSKNGLLLAVLGPLLVALSAAIDASSTQPDRRARREHLVAQLMDIQTTHHDAVRLSLDPSVTTEPSIATSLEEVDAALTKALAPGRKKADRDAARAALAVIRTFTPADLQDETRRSHVQQMANTLLRI